MPDIIQTKTCSKCKQIKPVSEFHKHRKTHDGLQNYCKQCGAITHKAYLQTDRGKDIQRGIGYRFNRTEHGIQVRHRYNQKYRQTEIGRINTRRGNRKYHRQHPEKTKAGSALNHAITAGRLTPAKIHKCAYCDEQAEQYHHVHGYAPEHWLDVIPLCRSCHRAIHYPSVP